MKIFSGCILTMLVCISFSLLMSCSSNTEKGRETTAATVKSPEDISNGNDTIPEYGVGPVESVSLEAEIDEVLAQKGKAIYDTKCISCHTFEQRMIGPPLNGVTEKRNPAWIMNMILNPQEMTKKDPIGKALLREYNTQMVNMNVNEEDARALLEYLRSKDRG